MMEFDSERFMKSKKALDITALIWYNERVLRVLRRIPHKASFRVSWLTFCRIMSIRCGWYPSFDEIRRILTE